MTLLGPSDERGRNKRVPIITTSISGSGKTFAVVREKDFLIYQNPSATPLIVGRICRNGDWQYGLDERPPSFQPKILAKVARYRFGHAAINDNVLVGGLTGSGCVLMFSISQNNPGRFICQGATNGGVVHMIFFNRQGTEVVVIHTLHSKREESWQFWKVPDRAAQLWAPLDTEYGGDVAVPADRCISLKMTFQNGTKGHLYATRDAKFSQSGDKVVACTSHSEGTSLVTMFAKNREGNWENQGSRQIRESLHLWDEGCWGFTGVELYISDRRFLLTF